jgi:hypothetical protein
MIDMLDAEASLDGDSEEAAAAGANQAPDADDNGVRVQLFPASFPDSPVNNEEPKRPG